MTETGVAILFSVLLTVPFSARFEGLTPFQKDVYLAALGLSAATTVTLIAPVARHRRLFAKGHKPALVRTANALSMVGLGLLCLTLGAVLLLLTDVILDGVAPLLVSLAFTATTALLWFVLPLGRGSRR